MKSSPKFAKLMPERLIEPLSVTRATCCMPPNVKTAPESELLILPWLTSPRVGWPLELETVGSPSSCSAANKKPGIGREFELGLLKPPPLLLTKSTLSKDDGEPPSQVGNGPSMAAPR